MPPKLRRIWDSTTRKIFLKKFIFLGWNLGRLPHFRMENLSQVSYQFSQLESHLATLFPSQNHNFSSQIEIEFFHPKNSVPILAFSCSVGMCAYNSLSLCRWYMLLFIVNIGFKKGVWPFIVGFGLEKNKENSIEFLLKRLCI